jgi:hypothetical protein
MIKVGEYCYFSCDECPMLSKDSLEHRISLWEEYGDFQFDHLGCDKVDFEFFAGGYCEDAFVEIKTAKKKGIRKSGAAYRREMDIKKKKRSIRNATLEARSCGAGYVDYDFVNGVWTPVGKYVKRPKNSHRQKFYKRYSNHLFRRGATTGSGKAGYKRCFDYRWEIE